MSKHTSQHQPSHTAITHSVDNQAADSRDPAFRLRDMFKPSFDLWVISWLLGLIFAISIIALLMISGWFISAAALAGMLAVGSHAFNYMMPAGIIRMLAIARTASRYGELMVSHNAVFDLLKTLRLRFFERLSALPLVQQRNALHASQYMHRLVNDIDRLDEFILRVVSPWLIGTIVVTLLALFIGFALPIDPTLKRMIYGLLALALLVPLLGTYLGIQQARQLAEVSEARRQKLLAPLAIITQLLLWQQWRAQTADYIEQDNLLQDLEWRAQKRRSAYMLGIQWLFYAGVLVVLFAITQLSQGAAFDSSIMHMVSVPLVLAVVLGLIGIQEIIVPLGQHYLALGNSIAAKQRLNALLTTHSTATEPSPKTKDNTEKSELAAADLPLPTGEMTATLDRVYAKIPKALVGAQDVSVTITSGTPLIIRGASGCGKSTLLQMLAGELSLLKGEVTLNDAAWHDYDWRDQLGYLGQQLDIFDQSLAANLRLGKPNASDAELLAALDKVGLSKWLQAQPQGLATPLGEYGAAVSGGQARRIALARLLLKPRRVLLLDEPFAGLDAQTRAQVWHHVREQQKNDLLIVVSHHEWDMGHCQLLTLKEQVFTNDTL